jgi:hypothetical protein
MELELEDVGKSDCENIALLDRDPAGERVEMAEGSPEFDAAFTVAVGARDTRGDIDAVICAVCVGLSLWHEDIDAPNAVFEMLGDCSADWLALTCAVADAAPANEPEKAGETEVDADALDGSDALADMVAKFADPVKEEVCDSAADALVQSEKLDVEDSEPACGDALELLVSSELGVSVETALEDTLRDNIPDDESIGDCVVEWERDGNEDTVPVSLALSDAAWLSVATHDEVSLGDVKAVGDLDAPRDIEPENDHAEEGVIVAAATVTDSNEEVEGVRETDFVSPTPIDGDDDNESAATVAVVEPETDAVTEIE